jgi:hypothetical protein
MSVHLADALRAWARGLYPVEAAVELLIAHGTWLRRGDFLDACTGPCEGPAGEDDWSMVWIDWPAVAAFEGASSSSEWRIRQIAAELAGTNTSEPLGELLSSLDDTNTGLVLDAIAHARGWHARYVTRTVTGWLTPGDDR